MAIVNQVNKRIRLDTRVEMVRFQISFYCYFRDIKVGDKELDCLALLAIDGPVDLNVFCSEASLKMAEPGDVRTSLSQSIRNHVTKGILKNLVIKEGKKSKKRVMINPDMQIQTKDSILLDYKVAFIET